MKTKTINIEENLLTKIKVYCAENNLKINEFVNSALEDKIKDVKSGIKLSISPTTYIPIDSKLPNFKYTPQPPDEINNEIYNFIVKTSEINHELKKRQINSNSIITIEQYGDELTVWYKI